MPTLGTRMCGCVCVCVCVCVSLCVCMCVCVCVRDFGLTTLSMVARSIWHTRSFFRFSVFYFDLIEKAISQLLLPCSWKAPSAIIAREPNYEHCCKRLLQTSWTFFQRTFSNIFPCSAIARRPPYAFFEPAYKKRFHSWWTPIELNTAHMSESSLYHIILEDKFFVFKRFGNHCLLWSMRIRVWSGNQSGA